MDLKEVALHLRDFRGVYVTGNPAMLRSRTDFLDIFSAYGLTADMSVSKKTGLLIVCSDPMQKKIDRAAALNIPTISEQQWFELMPELEALGMWNGKPLPFADDNGIYRFDVGGDG
jgi:BRCT domain type II-containing protein